MFTKTIQCNNNFLIKHPKETVSNCAIKIAPYIMRCWCIIEYPDYSLSCWLAIEPSKLGALISFDEIGSRPIRFEESLRPTHTIPLNLREGPLCYCEWAEMCRSSSASIPLERYDSQVRRANVFAIAFGGPQPNRLNYTEDNLQRDRASRPIVNRTELTSTQCASENLIFPHFPRDFFSPSLINCGDNSHKSFAYFSI